MRARIHQLNIEESKKVYGSCRDDIIAYGYLRSVENMYVRHCFLVDESGEAIGPTLFSHEYPQLNEHQSV